MNKLVIVFAFSLCFQTIFSQNKTIETSGDVLLYAMPTIVLGSTIIKGDTRGTWQFTKGAVVNFAITYGLKQIISKKRPNMENDNSFPSGHTSFTFQSASFIQRRYGWKYGIPAYLLASYTGYSRIQADKHDIFDVLAGAVIGIGSTYLFTTPYQQEHMELTFSGGKGDFLIGFKFRF
ncbi:phosphatase PAP2 family protein [Aureibaculum conchae]|uniref:phosphatase PAP2 family protein n=1 Tax=Aureibaculum sp. 2308TA14-22 TaxID=3108392 RepID=UPI0033963245